MVPILSGSRFSRGRESRDAPGCFSFVFNPITLSEAPMASTAFRSSTTSLSQGRSTTVSEIEQFIPPQYYRAVAELICYLSASKSLPAE
jgi:hypothetical protein